MAKKEDKTTELYLLWQNPFDIKDGKVNIYSLIRPPNEYIVAFGFPRIKSRVVWRCKCTIEGICALVFKTTHWKIEKILCGILIEHVEIPTRPGADPGFLLGSL